MGKLVDLDLNPDERKLRQFGWIALVGFGVLAAMAWFEQGIFGVGLGSSRETVAYALGGLGGISALFSLVFPKANRVLFVSLSVITFPIGFVLSYVIMGMLFFGMFAPIALFFRLIGRDPLRRRSKVETEKSFWVAARPKRPKGDYFKQY